MPLLIDEVIAEVDESPVPPVESPATPPESGTHQASLSEQLEKLRERQQRLEVD